MKSNRRIHSHFDFGPPQTQKAFTLLSVLFLVVIMFVLLAALAGAVSVRQRSVSAGRNSDHAKESAILGLEIALGELQATAGPDQRITATGSILDSKDNRYTNGTTPAPGQESWVGVWKSNTTELPDEPQNYSPASPDQRTFLGWLVSTSDDQGQFQRPQEIEAVEKSIATTPGSEQGLENHIALATNADGSPQFQVEKVLVDELTKGGNPSDTRVLRKRYFAFAVEDEGSKADLSWSEHPSQNQATRLSASPGPDYKILSQLSDITGPFDSLEHPFSLHDETQNIEIAKTVQQMRDLSDLTGILDAEDTWLKDSHPHITWGSRGILCDVKVGGLRKDLSLAFEMDGDAESESATQFNQQEGTFVAGSDPLSAIQPAPGMTQKARHLFRDFPGGDNPFSKDITSPETVVRGASWWALRDFANLYKRLDLNEDQHGLSARAYYPNRTTQGNPQENLFDIHAQKNGANRSIQVLATNREKNSSNGSFAYRPVRPSYAPVLIGVNAIYSLVYRNNRLQMVVDPFYILWNPYDVGISADKFAVTLENGLPGGVRFRVTDPDGNQTYHGRQSRWGNLGSDTSFFDYARNKSGKNAHLSYLISDLKMNPGEVVIYSPPSEDDRSSDATVLNDELLPGLNYDATESGIFFDQFPDSSGGSWAPIQIPNSELSNYKIEVLFNILSQNSYAISNATETNLPSSDVTAKDLTTEQNYGDHIQGKEFRLNFGGGQNSTNIDVGTRGFSLDYSFSELTNFKKSFGMLSMLTIPTDYTEADTKFEVFSQLNVTPIVSTNTELFGRAPLNVVVKTVPADGINNLMNKIGIDLDAFGDGNNGFYGKDFSLTAGDRIFPLLSIPKAPLHSLVQFSSANFGTRLFEPTHPIGNSWKPAYIPPNSIYYNSGAYFLNWEELTMHDASWLYNDALFDQYFLSGIAPDFDYSGANQTYQAKGDLKTALENFLGSDQTGGLTSPILQPYIPSGQSISDIIDELNPEGSNTDGYKKMGAYSLIKGAFNVNSTSIPAWAAFLSANKNLPIKFPEGDTDSAEGSPFPLSNSPISSNSDNGWEKFSRLTDEQIWDDQGTSDNFDDDTGLAAELVKEVKKRGPFMSLSGFVNRRITTDEDANQGAIQQAIENSNINGDQTGGIRSITSDSKPNYSNYQNVFPFSDANTVGKRNNATGIPLEINQANVLLPLAPRLTARSDTFRIRAYGEVRDGNESQILSRATCEAIVQRVPEYLDTNSNQPWDETDELSDLNRKFGRRFKIVQFRWLAPNEL